MFQKLTFYNFQRYKKKEVVFAPGCTIIVGASDKGKSSILRALGFVCLNRWDASFLKHGKKSTKLILTVDDKKVTREKGKTVNRYALGNKEFKAFGQSNVPEEVALFLNVGPENFQRQLDAHFWFSDSPGQVSKKLNQIVNLGKIDSTLAAVATELRETKAELTVTETRLSEARQGKDGLKWVVEFAADLDHLEALKTEAEESHKTASRIDDILRVVSAHSARLDRLSHAILGGKNRLRHGRTYLLRAKQRKKLGILIKDLVELSSVVNEPTPDISELDAVRGHGDKVAERRRDFEVLVTELVKTEKDKLRLSSQLSEVELTLKKKAKGKCPLCGTKTQNHLRCSPPTSTYATSRR